MKLIKSNFLIRCKFQFKYIQRGGGKGVSPLSSYLNSHLPFLLFFFSLSNPSESGLVSSQLEKHPLFPFLPESVSDSVWAWTQFSLWPKISPMAPLAGTGHIDRRHTALKIRNSSATTPPPPLVHSLAPRSLTEMERGIKVMQCYSQD